MVHSNDMKESLYCGVLPSLMFAAKENQCRHTNTHIYLRHVTVLIRKHVYIYVPKQSQNIKYYNKKFE